MSIHITTAYPLADRVLTRSRYMETDEHCA